MDKILEERENLQKTFEQFQFYIDNFKPISQIDPKHREKMQKFLNQAYECHLNLNKKPEEEVGKQIRLFVYILIYSFFILIYLRVDYF